MDSMELFEKVAKQGDSVRKLKSEKASKEDIMAAVDLLKQLKVEFKEATGQDYQPGESTFHQNSTKMIFSHKEYHQMVNQALLQLNPVEMLLHLGMSKLILTRVSIMINSSNVLDRHQFPENY